MSVPTLPALIPPSFAQTSPNGNGVSHAAGPTWPLLDRSALQGLAGDVVDTIAPETEADPAALLVSFLVAFGSAVGLEPHTKADGARHPAKLNAVIVGDSSKARKGTSWQRIRAVMAAADPDWAHGHVTNGLSTGEGLIGALEKLAAHDRRLLVQEPEFAKVLRVSQGRQADTLSGVLRESWDGDRLAVLTRGDPLRVTGAHVSVLGHITMEELRTTLGGVEATNGFANRFLFACSRRARSLPEGGNLDDQVVVGLGASVGSALERARERGRLSRSRAARELWAETYTEAGRDDPGGLLGGVIARAEAQLLRLSLAYALLDPQARHIEPAHIEAARAVWAYCRTSAAFIFGDRLGNPLAEKVLALVRHAGTCGLTRTELGRALAGHYSARSIDQALESLAARGLVSLVSVGTTGRPRTVILAVDHAR